MVKSGASIAEAAIEALKAPGIVSVAFDGLKGATSSYFNEFLRRIDQWCGRPELSERLQFTFDSKVQKMVFDRSLDALARRPHKPSPVGSKADSNEDTSQQSSGSFLSRLRNRLFNRT